METNNRHNRQRFGDDYRDRQSHHYRRVDEDIYRGAYRFDNESDHHNETTYDGFDLNDSMAQHRDQQSFRRAENNHGGDYIYRISKNREDNDRRYRSQPQQRDYSQEDRRNQRNDWHNNRSNDNRYGDGFSNFNNDYGPDPYHNQHRNENYGNMAGSLSYGYDGDFNADPDHHRRYDPLSGKLTRHDGPVRRNQADRYGPPDRFGINPDYDRY